MIATLVDVGALWRTAWTAAVAGILVTVTCSVAVLGVARASEHHRVHAEALAGRWAVVGLLGALATAGVIVYGLWLVTR